MVESMTEGEVGGGDVDNFQRFIELPVLPQTV